MGYGKRKFKKYNRRGGNYKKRGSTTFGRFMSGAGKVAKIASTALSIAKGVAAVVNTEYKHFDKTTSLSPNTSGLVYHLTNIPQGDDDNQRNGRSIRTKSLYIRGEFKMSNSTPITSYVSNYYRLLLVMDRENKGTLPTVSDILETTSWNSPLKMDNSRQWVVLKDKLITLDNAKGRSKVFKYFKPLDTHIKYQGTGAAQADSRNNQLFLVAISNESNPDVLPIFEFYSRLRYIDN